ncbi:actin-histidine N-methyltransferase-like [Phoenix dactylifera]|uniref:Actin-histidine N-methyltransferase-like n=1 Tax=Phoenix dactylifera TaxID=42345 RepID=A0A8B8ZS27_PHODC|nr:actin-histidine N-methyltransferase-like [Phoenix dactylifera]
MAASAASKVLTATVDFVTSSTSSLTHRRQLTSSAPPVTAAARIVPHPPDLVRWVRREGGLLHPKLKIADHPYHGLGVVATDDIPQRSELVVLPSHLPLRLRRDPEPDGGGEGPDSVLSQLARRVPEELWAMRLGLRLLQERAMVGSFWWPYISNLPEAFNVPIFFSREDIKNLQYAPLLHQVNKRCRFLLEFEKEIKLMLEDVALKDHPFGGQDVNASSLGWALSAVSSRAFRLHGEILPNGKNADIPMLLPLIDMCNHSFQPNARIVQEQDLDSPNMSLKVVAETPIEQDTPVMLNYGCLSNDLFLLDYGFVIPSNPFDYVELKYDGTLLDAASMAAGVSTPSFLSPKHWQEEILSQLNLQGDQALLKVSLGGPELVDGRLLAALRVLLSNDEETAQRHDLNTLMSLSEEAPLGVPIEVAALRTVIALSVIALEHFPTKIMEDESILKGNVSSSKELAIQFRMQKKLMIKDVMRKLTQRVKMLSEEKSTA